jgi:hypothetical protein
LLSILQSAQHPPEEKFHCFISSEFFLISSWRVVRAIAYLAISIGLVRILENYANVKPLPVLPGETQWGKSCPDAALQQCLICHLSASRSQSLAAAIAARSFVLSPTGPLIDLARKRCDDSKASEESDAIWFDYDHSWGQGFIVWKEVFEDHPSS